MSDKTLNLQQIAENWAWRRFDSRATKSEKKLMRKQRPTSDSPSDGPYIRLQLDWSHVEFVDHTDWVSLCDEEDDQGSSSPRQGQSGQGQSGQGQSGQGQSGQGQGQSGQGRSGAVSRPATSGVPKASVLFRTKFSNHTGEDQEYTMKTEKTTKSSCSTEIDTCYTRGLEMGVTLKAPGELFEANVGYSREFSLSNTHGQTFEEELHWGVESVIKVKSKTEAEARLEVNEKKECGEFSIVTKIWGKVYARFFLVENNKHLLTSGDQITDIVETYLKEQRKIHKKKDLAYKYVTVKEVVEEEKGPQDKQGNASGISQPSGATKGESQQRQTVDNQTEGKNGEQVNTGGGGGPSGGSEKQTVKVKKIFIETKGRCHFRYGVNQEIKVHQVELPQ